MGDFPTEIVVDITSHLSFADKINLACTCKQLHRTISQSTHYNKLVLKKDSSLSDDYACFLKKKGFGQQVRSLGLTYLFFRAGNVNIVSAASVSGII